MCFLDFGLLRGVDAARVAAERAIALAVRDGDAEALKAALRAGGCLPASRADAVDGISADLMRMAIRWYAVPRSAALALDRRDRDRERPDPEERAAMRMEVNQFTLPPEAILIGGCTASTRGPRAAARGETGRDCCGVADGEAPATLLGRAEAEFLARRGRTAGAALGAAD